MPTDEECRLSRVIEAQEKALAHWRTGADRDAGTIKRLYAALTVIATMQSGNIESARRRALQEL
jgi:hypothetical protein